MFVSIIDAFLKPDKTSRDIQVLNMELLAYNFHESLNLKPLFAYLRRTIHDSDEPEVKKKGFLNRLEKVASDVTDKQMLVLAEVGQKFDTTIDLKAVIEHPYRIDADARTLTLKWNERTFRLLPLKVDLESREVQFRLEIIIPSLPKVIATNSGLDSMTFR